MNNTHTEFERYYRQVRFRQQWDTLCASVLLLALYFSAGLVAEFNLLTLWHALPDLAGYLSDTLPTLQLTDLFASSHIKGSLAWRGYRLPIQLSLILETLQLAPLQPSFWRSLRPVMEDPLGHCALPYVHWWRS